MKQFKFSQLHDENSVLRPRREQNAHVEPISLRRESKTPMVSRKLVWGIGVVAVLILIWFVIPKNISLPSFFGHGPTPTTPPVVSIYLDPSLSGDVATTLGNPITADATHYQTATAVTDAGVEASVVYSGKVLTEQDHGVYLVPVVQYKHLMDGISLKDLPNYEVMTTADLAPVLTKYFTSHQLTVKVTPLVVQPAPTTTSPQGTDDSQPATMATFNDLLFAQLDKAYKRGRNIIGIIPVTSLDSRFKALTWEKTDFFNQFTTKNPATNPDLLSFVLQVKVHDGLTAEQQALTTPLLEATTAAWQKEYPAFDATKLSSVRITGVTAISRQAAAVTDRSGDPAYMAGKIAAFLADADLTHTSNEVSFGKTCKANVNTMRFCAAPQYIQALEKSGMDIIELTGNHNNDFGAANNTSTINMYKERNWDYFGGGLDSADAAKILYKDVKGTKVAFIGYNYYDTIYKSAALAGKTTAGANSYGDLKMKRDIAEARKNADVVEVHFQFQECWAYTTGNTLCYQPISSPPQKAIFRLAVDDGADIVVGTQAHQPQTFENYNGKMIFYGLGNLFFDQDEWLGTRQGLILTHYFYGGKYLTTGVTTTIYDSDLRPYVTSGSKRRELLKALHQGDS